MPLIRPQKPTTDSIPAPTPGRNALPLPLILGLGTAVVLIALAVPLLIGDPPPDPAPVVPEPAAAAAPQSQPMAGASLPDGRIGSGVGGNSATPPSVDPGSRTEAIEGKPLYLSNEDVRQAQLRMLKERAASQPTSTTERSSLAATPEEIRKMEETGAMMF